MLARLSAFVIWGLVAATAVFWGLRLLVRAPAAPAYAVAVGDAAAVRGDLTRLLGAAPVNAPAAVVASEASSRFRLLGIVAPKYSAGAAATRGVALIAVDGKMPRAYAVGSRLDGDLVLQSVTLRTVSIASAPGVPAITLELPPLAAAATGALPSGGGNASFGIPPVVTVPQYVAQPVAPQPMVPQPVPPPPFVVQPVPPPPTQSPAAPAPRPGSNAPLQ